MQRACSLHRAPLHPPTSSRSGTADGQTARRCVGCRRGGSSDFRVANRHRQGYRKGQCIMSERCMDCGSSILAGESCDCYAGSVSCPPDTAKPTPDQRSADFQLGHRLGWNAAWRRLGVEPEKLDDFLRSWDRRQQTKKLDDSQVESLCAAQYPRAWRTEIYAFREGFRAAERAHYIGKD